MSISDISEQQRKLDDALRRFGASMVGFCSVSDLEPEICKRLPYGIAIAIDHERSAVDALVEDDRPFLKVNQTARNRIYRIYGIACQMLRSWGYAYAPIPDDTQAELLADYSAEIPLKTLAIRAGFGWIGKSGLLVTSRYGPRIRLGGLLTDAPFETVKHPSASNCKDCTACVDVCPVGAISGLEWSPEVRREQIIDHVRCNDWRRESLATLGRKHECALCMAVCPVGTSTGANNVFSQAVQAKLLYAGGYRNGKGLLQVAGDSASDCELTPEELAFLEQDEDVLSDDTYEQFVEDCCSGIPSDLLTEEQDMATQIEPPPANTVQDMGAGRETAVPDVKEAREPELQGEPSPLPKEIPDKDMPDAGETENMAAEPAVIDTAEAVAAERGAEGSIAVEAAGEEKKAETPDEAPKNDAATETVVIPHTRRRNTQPSHPRRPDQGKGAEGENSKTPERPLQRGQNRGYGQRRNSGQSKPTSDNAESLNRAPGQEADRDIPSDSTPAPQSAQGSANNGKTQRRPSNPRRRPAVKNKPAADSPEANDSQVKPNPDAD